MRAVAAGQSAPGVVDPHEGACRAGTVFVYSGQGSQWAGMGRQLLADEPAFAAAVAELEPVFVEQAGFSLQQVLAGGEPVVGIDRIQPVLVGVQLALTALWRCYGVQPDAVIGHSMGEVTAAVVAGALSAGRRAAGDRHPVAADGAAGRAGRDGAAGVGPGGRRGVDRRLPGCDVGGVCLAAPDGDRRAARTGRRGDRGGGRAGPAGAAHRGRCGLASPDHRSDIARVASALADLAPQRPTIPVITTTQSTPQPGQPVFDAEYWAANLRNPVRFSQAVAAAGADHATFVEVSPHPLLTHAISDTLAEVHHHSIGTLQRDTDDTLTFHTNLNATHTIRPPHTEHPPEPHPLLPTTPWHHTHHWISGTSAVPVAGHPLLGIGVTDPNERHPGVGKHARSGFSVAR